MNPQLFRPSAYFSIDGEFDGTNPLQHNMRSIGLALFTDRAGCIDQFYQNILPQTDAQGQAFPPDPLTMQNFWNQRPDLWSAVQDGAVTPQVAMSNLAAWLSKHNKFRFLFVAKPAACDWMWFKCYYEKYGPPDKPDIGYYCHDLSALLRAYFLTHNIVGSTDQARFVAALSGGAPYTHRADEDALYQGYMYMNLRRLLTQRCSQSVTLTEKGLDVRYQSFDFMQFPSISHLTQVMDDDSGVYFRERQSSR